MACLFGKTLKVLVLGENNWVILEEALPLENFIDGIRRKT